MTAAVAAVATALTAVAGLLLYLFRTRWSRRAWWEKEYAQLAKEATAAAAAYTRAVAAGDSDHLQLLARWRVLATELADLRAAGQRAGFLD